MATFNPEMLALLEASLSQYPTIDAVLETSQLSSGSILTPRGIESFSNDLRTNTPLLVECWSFLDAVEFLSIFHGDGTTSLATLMVNNLVASRTIADDKLLVNKDAMNDYVARNREELHALLDTNKPLLAFVTYAIIKQLFCK